MHRWLFVPAVIAFLAAAPLYAEGIKGQYVEARTCDVWTGPCFANAEINIVGKHAVMGWRVESGTLDNVRLDGLSVVAVIAATDTLGMQQSGPAKAVVIVDEKATKAQQTALLRFAIQQAGDLVTNVVAVETAPIDLSVCDCNGGTCGKLSAGKAHVETRCLDNHDKVCGNESAFFPPLAKGVDVRAAVALEHSFTGKGFDATWKDGERRSAYVGKFVTR